MSREAYRVVPLVALACLGPLALAALVYFGSFEALVGRPLENPDRLLESAPAPLPQTPLATPDGPTPPDWARYRWSLIYARISPCEGLCAEHLTRLTQVHVALGRDADRVRRVYLTPDAGFRMTGDPELLVAHLDRQRDFELIAALGAERFEHGRIFVVDPLGNLVMSYPPEADQARLLADLERLLDASRIG